MSLQCTYFFVPGHKLGKEYLRRNSTSFEQAYIAANIDYKFPWYNQKPVGRPRCRWVDNIRTGLQEVGCGYVDWIGLAQDRDRWRTLVSAVMNLRVLWNAGNFLTSCKPVSFSRRTLHHGVSKLSESMQAILLQNHKPCKLTFWSINSRCSYWG